MITLLLSLVLLLVATSVEAANRCTTGVTGINCNIDGVPTFYPTVQEAHDAALPGDIIRIAGIRDENVVQTKPNLVDCRPGCSVRGLPGGVAWHALNVPSHEVRFLPIVVGENGIGLLIEGGGGYAMNKGSVSCNGVGLVGIRMIGGTNDEILRASVTNCTEVGIDIIDTVGHSVEVNTISGNSVGIQMTRSSVGQTFFNTLSGNLVGARRVGDFHSDFNSNKFFCNGVPGCIGYVADISPTSNPQSGFTVNSVGEMNHQSFTGYAGNHIFVRLCDGSLVTTYQLSPERAIAYATNKADGVAIPNHTTPMGPGC